MNRQVTRLCITAFAITAFAIAACGTAATAAMSGAASASLVRDRAASLAAIPSLSLPQLAGQRVIYSYTGLNPPASCSR